MNLHPDKCKVLTICNSLPTLLGILPCIQFRYSLGDNLLEYVDYEKYLGVNITSKLV